jgi:multiple sugar transport system substrate-binding protein
MKALSGGMKMNKTQKIVALTLGLTTSVAVLLTTGAFAQQKTKISLWSHSAGNPTEIGAVQKMVDAFNAKQSKYQVAIEAFPQASYNDSVAAASVAGSLPCIIDMDGPTVPNFAWSGYLQPLPLASSLISSISPGDVGRYNGKVYSVGQFDVVLQIFARKSILSKYKIRVPTLAKPWKLDEFTGILKTLKASSEFEYAFDVNPGYGGEWWSYAYSPMLQSFGGDLIDRSSFQTASNALNGAAGLAWGKWFQSLFSQKYVNPTPADDQGFLQGRIPLWYTGSWAANDVVKKFGSDALFLPTVDFGKGPKIGGASWQWGISKTCNDVAGAGQFLTYAMQGPQVALFSNATGLIPSTRAGAKLTVDYSPTGKYRTYFDMLKLAVQRPATPAYLVISSQFEKAAVKIRDGGDVQNALDDAVDAINQNIKDNKGYK